MTNKTDAELDDLIEAVQTGEHPGDVVLCLQDQRTMDLFYGAYHGSLDAAKALHEALLPGWAWTIQENGEQTVWPPNDIADEPWCADGITACMNIDDPARAWLLAILKAYRAGSTP